MKEKGVAFKKLSYFVFSLASLFFVYVLAYFLNIKDSFLFFLVVSTFPLSIVLYLFFKQWGEEEDSAWALAKTKNFFYQTLLSSASLVGILFFLSVLESLFLYIFKIEMPSNQPAVDFFRTGDLTTWKIFFLFLQVVLIAPILEEILFRGFLQRGLLFFFGPFFSIGITSFFFALLHLFSLDLISMFTIFSKTFTLSVFLGFIFFKRKNIFLNVAIHSIFNLFNVMLIIFEKLIFVGF